MTTTVAPANVTYGTVVGRFLEMVEDSTDPDVKVDAVGKSDGTVTFVADVAYMLDRVSSPPATIIPTPIYASTDVDGYLVDDQGNPGVTLVATDGPTQPTNFTYQVTLAFPGVPARTFSIKVPAGTTVDLTTVSPMTSSTGRSETKGDKGDKGDTGATGPPGDITPVIAALFIPRAESTIGLDIDGVPYVNYDGMPLAQVVRALQDTDGVPYYEMV